MSDLVYWIWLSLACTPGSPPFSKLLASYDNAKEIYDAAEREIRACVGWKPSDCSNMVDKDLTRAEEIYNFCTTKGVGILKYDDKALKYKQDDGFLEFEILNNDLYTKIDNLSNVYNLPKTKIIEKYLYEQDLKDCVIYNQIDCFDILPKDVNKYAGLAYLSQIIGISKEEFVAVGDSLNDYPMFDFSKTSIGINLKDKSKALYNFNTINEALKFLLNY